MLTPSELKNLKGYFKTKKFKKDEIIFPQGQVADGAYIVLSGLIHLKKKHKIIQASRRNGYNIFNKNKIKSLIERFKPDAIINCASFHGGLNYINSTLK